MNYVLWRRPNSGMRGPSLAILVGSDNLSTYDKDFKIGSPVPLPPEHDGLGIEELKALYPCPPYAKDTYSEAKDHIVLKPTTV